MDPIFVTIPGAARGKGAPRHAAIMLKDGKPLMKDGRPIIAKHTDRKTGEYMGMVKAMAMRAMGDRVPLDAPVDVAMIVRVIPPESWPAWKKEAALAHRIAPDGKPDEDNIKKAIYDAFTGVVWRDDVEVVQSKFRKEYHPQAGVLVRVTLIDRASSRITRKDQLPPLPDLLEQAA